MREQPKPLVETAVALSEEQWRVLRDLRTVVAPQLAGLQENAEGLDLALDVLRWAVERVEKAREVKHDYSSLAGYQYAR